VASPTVAPPTELKTFVELLTLQRDEALAKLREAQADAAATRAVNTTLANAILRIGDQAATLAKTATFFTDFVFAVEAHAQQAVTQRALIVETLESLQTAVLSDTGLQQALQDSTSKEQADQFVVQVSSTPERLMPVQKPPPKDKPKDTGARGSKWEATKWTAGSWDK
jgi:hypothetical protein